MLFRSCFGKSNVSKDKPTPDGIKEIIEALLSKALEEGASEKTVSEYRTKWMGKLERFG